jgi:hypothetical protein
LLAAERPDQPGSDVKRHLAECASCRALYRRLVRVEHDIRHIPVPLSTRRPAFVAQFVQQTPVDLPVAARQTASDLPMAGQVILPLVKVTRPATPPKERGLRKLAIAIALAASLAIFAVGLWAMHVKGPDKPDHMAELRKKLDTRITYAETSREKAEIVVDFADEVQTEVRTLSQEKVVNGKQLADLAKFYRQLVSEDLKTQVRAVAQDIKDTKQRREVLTDLAARLQQTESEFAQLAVKARPDAEQPFKEIAAAAHDAGTMINDILTMQAG